MLVSSSETIQFNVPSWWITTAPAPDGSLYEVVADNPSATVYQTFFDNTLHPSASVDGGYLLQFDESLSGHEDIGFKTVLWEENGVEMSGFVHVQVWAVFGTEGAATYLISFLEGDTPTLNYGETATQIINSALDNAPFPDQNLNQLLDAGFIPVGLAENADPLQSRQQIYDGADDVVIGDSFHETIYAMVGQDEVKGRNGNDIIYGGDGDDKLFGNGHMDSLYGGFGSDRLNGGSGRDFLDGGFGKDFLRGGSGADTFSFLVQEGDDSRDKILDLDASDVAPGRIWLEVREFRNGIEEVVDHSQLTITQAPVAALVSYGNWSVAIKDILAADLIDILGV